MGLEKGAAALRWNKEKDEAPRLIAAGKGYLADKIMAIAEKAEIPIVERDPLADLLLQLDPGKEIPSELFQLAAEVYVFIMKLDEDLKVKK